MIYKFSLQQVVEPKFLTKLVERFKREEVPRFQALNRYYRTKNKILSRTMENGKPNNKLAHSFSKYITNMATAYFMGKPIKYIVEDAEFKEALTDVFNQNYTDSLNFELSKEASKKGISFELLYINEAGKLKSKKCNAEEIIPVYSNRVDEFLECAIRIWTDYDLDGLFLKEHASVYTKDSILLYERENPGGIFQMVDAQGHMLDDIPIIAYWNNEECSGDYEEVIPLINAYDKSQSDTGNDMEYFTDAYLCIVGAGGGLEDGSLEDEEDGEESRTSEKLRKNKLLFLDEKGQAFFLTKTINDTATENYKNRLFNDIFFLSQVPALSDESFAGNLSGVAIKYKLIGLEELAIMKQNKFDAAQKKKIKIVTAHLNTRLNKEFDPHEVKLKYERNFVENVTELIDNAVKLEGVISKDTQLNVLPNSVVSDSTAEIEKMEQEQARKEEIPLVSEETINQMFLEGGFYE